MFLCFQGTRREPPAVSFGCSPPSSGEGRCWQPRGRSGTPSFPSRAPGTFGKRIFQMSWFDLWGRHEAEVRAWGAGGCRETLPFDSSTTIRTFILEYK